MNAPALALAGGFALLGVLLLALLLRSGWRWPVKAALIVLTAAGAIGLFGALQAWLGLPTRAALPAAFRLHAGVVDEPDPRDHLHPGAIYLWVSPKPGLDIPPAPPRAHAFPYSRELHEDLAEALARLKEGTPIEGRAEPAATSQGFSPRASGFELFEAPRPRLPAKP